LQSRDVFWRREAIREQGRGALVCAEGGPLPSRQIDALSLLADYLVDEAFPPKTSPTAAAAEDHVVMISIS
jgi:methylmalonyl-CoA mutase cobalamin-binding subunit